MTSFTPGPPTAAPDPLALNEAKTLGPLISSAFRLWLSRPSVFVLTASVIVVPFEVIVLGVLGHGFAHADGTADLWARLVSTFTINILGSALVTATHAKSVVALADRKPVSTAGAFRLGLDGCGLVAAAALLYWVATIIGLALIIVPGIFIAVAGIFSAQIAALERLTPVAAIKASVALVRAVGWWRTWGYLFTISFIGGIVAAVIGGVLGAFNAPGSVFVIALAIIETATLSYTALITTLLYFSWKAQTGVPTPAANTGNDLTT